MKLNMGQGIRSKLTPEMIVCERNLVIITLRRDTQKVNIFRFKNTTLIRHNVWSLETEKAKMRATNWKRQNQVLKFNSLKKVIKGCIKCDTEIQSRIGITKDAFPIAEQLRKRGKKKKKKRVLNSYININPDIWQ